MKMDNILFFLRFLLEVSLELHHFLGLIIETYCVISTSTRSEK